MNKNLDELLSNLIASLQSEGAIFDDFTYSNLWDIVRQLTSDQYIKLRENIYFVDLLENIKVSDLPIRLLKSEVYEEHQNFTHEEFMLPDPNTKLDFVVFNNDFDKLILKVRNSSTQNGCIAVNLLSDILNLDQAELASLSGVGTRYVELWKKLKEYYQSHITSDLPFKESKEAIVFSSKVSNINLDDIILIYKGLNIEERKCIKKFEQIKPNFTIKDILEFDRNHFLRTVGVGVKFIELMYEIKSRVEDELEQVSTKSKDLYKFECSLISPMSVKEISLEKLSSLLTEDIEIFLDGQPEDLQDIFQKRWGFVEAKTTLEDLGVTYGLTRERIRQKETKCNEHLVRSLRITSNNIWDLLQGRVDLNLTKNMSNLSDCFDTEKSFFEFIGFICGNKDIEKLIRPEIPLDLLGNFFSLNGAPCNYDEVKDYIQEYSLVNNLEINIDNAICFLQENERIKIDGERIFPQKLKKEEAAACVLSKHQNGLPWMDIAKLVNAAGISRTDLYLDRLDHAALANPDAIYLAGKGVYKHVRFMRLEDIDLDLVFDELLRIFVDSDRKVMHLGEICQSSNYLKTLDYYAVRYLVKCMGQEYGFYFDGKSQADSVGIEPNFKNITQRDVIIQALLRNKKPMTKVEIASLLKSKSLGHASFYLDQMIDKQQIVQVDRMLYTLPELAYKDIDILLFVNSIHAVLADEERPVDPSVFEVKLNGVLGETYSRFFYASIARKYAENRGWCRKQNLYSLSEIPYKNLMNAIDIICLREKSVDENCKRLQEHIAVTRDKAGVTIGQWVRG